MLKIGGDGGLEIYSDSLSDGVAVRMLTEQGGKNNAQGSNETLIDHSNTFRVLPQINFIG